MSNTNKIILEKLPTDLQKKVGNTLMGSHDDIAKLQKRKPEDDTNWESNLYYYIRDWTGQSDSDVAKYFKKNKELLNTLAKEFPEVLKAPKGSMAYRGTQIKTSSLIKTLKNSGKIKFVKIGGKGYLYIKKVPYSPYRDAQSWTTNAKTATGFNDHTEESSVHVLYMTKVNNDFIFSPKLMNIIFYGKEDETVRVAKAGKFDAFISANILENLTFGTDFKTVILIGSQFSGMNKALNGIVEKYNTLVDKHNKFIQKQLVKTKHDWDVDYSKSDLKNPVKTISRILQMYDHPYDTPNTSDRYEWNEFVTGQYFDLDREVIRAWQAYLKTIK